MEPLYPVQRLKYMHMSLASTKLETNDLVDNFSLLRKADEMMFH
jgi:hypothetical protein